SSSSVRGRSVDRLQISGAERTQGGLTKVDSRLRFAEQLMLSDARRFQLSLACPNYAGFCSNSQRQRGRFQSDVTRIWLKLVRRFALLLQNLINFSFFVNKIAEFDSFRVTRFRQTILVILSLLRSAGRPLPEIGNFVKVGLARPFAR